MPDTVPVPVKLIDALSGMTGLAALILWIPVDSTVTGWAASLMWGWFAVPLGAPPVTIWQAVGLACILSLYRVLPKAEENPKPWKILSAAVSRTTVRLMVLGVGSLAYWIS